MILWLDEYSLYDFGYRQVLRLKFFGMESSAFSDQETNSISVSSRYFSQITEEFNHSILYWLFHMWNGQDLSHTSLGAAVKYNISDWYLSILSVSLGKSTSRHSNCCITYMCPCGCFTLYSWGSRLNSGLLGCGQMDFIFLILLELDYSLRNCFFFCDNPQTSELITDNQISKQTKGF